MFSPSGASAGVGFAMPIDTVNRVVPQLIARGKYIRPDLGIAVDEGLNRAAMEQLRVDGALILRVTPGSPAAAVGLRGVELAAEGSMVPGDIIVAIDGRPVESVVRLLARIAKWATACASPFCETVASLR